MIKRDQGPRFFFEISFSINHSSLVSFILSCSASFLVVDVCDTRFPATDHNKNSLSLSHSHSLLSIFLSFSLSLSLSLSMQITDSYFILKAYIRTHHQPCVFFSFFSSFLSPGSYNRSRSVCFVSPFVTSSRVALNLKNKNVCS